MLSFIKHLFQGRPTEKRAFTVEMGQSVGLMDGVTRAGVHVSEQSALGVSAVWAAVKVIAEGVGSLDLHQFKKQKDGGRKEVTTGPFAEMLASEPNPEMTWPVFFEVLMSHALLWGTAYAEIERNGAGEPIAVYPVHPRWVVVERNIGSGGLLYRITQPINTVSSPSEAGHVVTLDQSDMLAIPGCISIDGSQGYNLLRLARENIAYSIACDRFGQAYFGNSARIGALLSTPNKLSDEARQNLRSSFHALNGGVDASGRTALLEEGMTFTPLTYSDEGGMYSTTREFQVLEVARLFNLNPARLQDWGRQTWGNYSIAQTEFATITLRPWINKIEHEIRRKIDLGPDGYVEFDLDSMLRGDITTRYAAYQVGITAGFLEVDDVRGWENLPPLPEPEPVAVPALLAPPAPGAAPGAPVDPPKDPNGKAIPTK